MKKLLTFASVIALAVAFGLAGAASAKRPEGAGGGPPGGPYPTVSEFSSPFVELDDFGNGIGEVPGSIGTINSLGVWEVATSGLEAGHNYWVCLVGFLDGSTDETTVLLSDDPITADPITADDPGGGVWMPGGMRLLGQGIGSASRSKS